MGSESSTIHTNTTMTNTVTHNTTNNYKNDTYYINVTIPQTHHYHIGQHALGHDVPGRSALTHSLPKLQGNNNNHESEYMINATLDNERESSTINKKQYLQSAVLNCQHKPVWSNDVRQTFERNKWEFKEDDFNDICNDLLTIRNLEQRLDTIKTVRICLEESIESKLKNKHSDVDIFFHFSDVINELFKATKGAIDKPKFNEKQHYNAEEEQQQFYEVSQSHQLPSTTSNATEILPYHNIDEQTAILKSFNYN